MIYPIDRPIRRFAVIRPGMPLHQWLARQQDKPDILFNASLYKSVRQGIGYVLPLGRSEHWRLEFGLQAGFFNTPYDPYQWRCPINPDSDPEQYYYKWYGDAKNFKKRQHRYTWLGPTRLEITLSYDILYRRNHKKGVSFRSHETAARY